MELRDFIVTPILISLIYAVAFFVRPYVTDSVNRRYFFPALTVRIFGAIALGLLYQFYYQGGDTFNFHTHGSRIVWEIFMDSPSKGIELLLSDGSNVQNIYESSHIYFLHDPSSFFVIRIASLFDLFTFSSYSATAVLFSIFSFIGMWMLFLTFYQKFPHLHYQIAIATFFIPSVFFWGSGLLKDTIVLGCLGISTHCFSRLFFERRIFIGSILWIAVTLYIIFRIRVFVLQAYLPATIVWITAYHFNSIRSILVRVMIIPFFAAILLYFEYYIVLKVGETDTKYSVGNLAETSRITAYDIGFFTGRDAGSGYSLNIDDWTPLGMLRNSPAAINVTLFRPYLWEVRNPLMLISSLESTFLLLFSLYILLKNSLRLYKGLFNYDVLFCLVFSLIFAFAIGISTFNFGTLARYRIPLLPFYLIALIILNTYSNKERKLGVLDVTE